MTHTPGNIKSSKPILIFNAAFTLVAIARSLRAAAELLKSNPQSISHAATGRIVASAGYYFRYIPEDMEIEITHIGNLDLKEYDMMTGESNRKYHNSRYMKGKRVLNFKTNRFQYK